MFMYVSLQQHSMEGVVFLGRLGVGSNLLGNAYIPYLRSLSKGSCPLQSGPRTL